MGLLTSVNNINNSIVKTQNEKTQKENKKELQKIHENNLILALQEYFYKQFKKSDDFSITYLNLINIKEREQNIFLVSEKIENKQDFDIRFINSIYEKELQKIYKIFNNNKNENIKYLKKELERYLQEEFKKHFEIAGTSYTFEFYSKERKQEIFNNFLYDFSYYSNQFDIEELKQHFDNKYNTILNKCKKEQEQQEEYELITEGNKLLQEQEQNKKQDNFNPELFDKGLKIGIVILLFPIISILAIISGIMKNSD